MDIMGRTDNVIEISPDIKEEGYSERKHHGDIVDKDDLQTVIGHAIKCVKEEEILSEPFHVNSESNARSERYIGMTGECDEGRQGLFSTLPLTYESPTQVKSDLLVDRYDCDTCKMTFGQRDSLESHMLTHAGEKPYACNICQKGFIKACALNSHMRTHKVKRKKPFLCYICQKSFCKSFHMEKHILKHKRGYKLQCNVNINSTSIIKDMKSGPDASIAAHIVEDPQTDDHKGNVRITSTSIPECTTPDSRVKMAYKNITTQSMESNIKLDYCLFCDRQYRSNISKHYLCQHSDTQEVKHIRALPYGSKQRKDLFRKLQNEGNFKHNTMVIKSRVGEIVIARRPKQSSAVPSSDYLPCQFCLGFYYKHQLKEHAPKCSLRPLDASTTNLIEHGRMMLEPFVTSDTQQDNRNICVRHIIHSNNTSKRGWTYSENLAFQQAFQDNIKARRNLTSSLIKRAKENFPILISKSDALLRTRMNNIVNGKQQFIPVSEKNTTDAPTVEKFSTDFQQPDCDDYDSDGCLDDDIPNKEIQQEQEHECVGGMNDSISNTSLNETIVTGENPAGLHHHEYLPSVKQTDGYESDRIDDKSHTRSYGAPQHECDENMKYSVLDKVPDDASATDENLSVHSDIEYPHSFQTTTDMASLFDFTDTKMANTTGKLQEIQDGKDGENLECNVSVSRMSALEDICDTKIRIMDLVEANAENMTELLDEEKIKSDLTNVPYTETKGHGSEIYLDDLSGHLTVIQNCEDKVDDTKAEEKNGCPENVYDRSVVGGANNIYQEVNLPILQQIDRKDFKLDGCKDVVDGKNSVEFQGPQRSNVKEAFKNIAVQSMEGKLKMDYCLFCGAGYKSKISKHYISKHSDSLQMQCILALPLGSKQRKDNFRKLQNEGNFKHNAQVIEKGQGEIVISRRPKQGSKYQSCDFLPCEFCLGFYHKDHLMDHMNKNCPLKPIGTSTCNSVQKSKLLLPHFMSHVTHTSSLQEAPDRINDEDISVCDTPQKEETYIKSENPTQSEDKKMTTKRRWTDDENRAFEQAFGEHLRSNTNLTTSSIKRAKRDFPILSSKSDAILRTRMNNIVKGKQSFFVPLV